mmetsp:Transcript_76255/g.220209  ORF Transcript_76255/g.220209 Transcript_76255/m.220209 type:complete len:230 (-) Transcript_76255:897-1586(-)
MTHGAPAFDAVRHEHRPHGRRRIRTGPKCPEPCSRPPRGQNSRGNGNTLCSLSGAAPSEASVNSASLRALLRAFSWQLRWPAEVGSPVGNCAGTFPRADAPAKPASHPNAPPCARPRSDALCASDGDGDFCGGDRCVKAGGMCACSMCDSTPCNIDGVTHLRRHIAADGRPRWAAAGSPRAGEPVLEEAALRHRRAGAFRGAECRRSHRLRTTGSPPEIGGVSAAGRSG